MIKFKPNNYYRVNKKIDSFNVYVISRTNNFVTIHYQGKTAKLKVRTKFFGACEHLLIPTQYKDVTLFCVSTNMV